MNTIYSIKGILLVCFIGLSFVTKAQGLVDKRSFDEVKTTAEYGRGERQAQAQFELSYRYLYGEYGAPEDYEISFYWCKRAADNGHVFAMYMLGRRYEDGLGVKRDLASALKYYRLAADNNNEYAPKRLGDFYFEGLGVEKDFFKAASYYKDAAFTGNNEGMYDYSFCLYLGLGVAVDTTKAQLWAERAIDSGNHDAYWLLGQVYKRGIGVKQDLEEALYYYEEGAKDNNARCLYELYSAYKVGGILPGITIDIEKSNEFEKQLLGINKWKDDLFQLADVFINAEFGITDFGAAEQCYLFLGDHGILDGYNTLAYAYAKGEGCHQNINMALELIDKAISADPSDPYWLDSKGEFYLIGGDIQEARRIWTQILTINPDFYTQYRQDFEEDTELNKYMLSHQNTK